MSCRRKAEASSLLRSAGLALLILGGTVCQAAVPARFTLAWLSQVDPDRAVRSVGSPNWYDRSEDSFAPPATGELRDNDIRTDGWIAQEKTTNPSAATGTGSQQSNSWNWRFPQISGDVASAFIIGLLAIILLTILLMLTRHSIRYYRPGIRKRKAKQNEIAIDPTRVVDLPFQAEEAHYENPLAQAEALVKAGNFSAAIVLLYGYQLLVLDQARKIELHRGKTNRMYLNELASHKSLLSMLGATISVFEEAYFGRRIISKERFMAIWDRLPEFQELVTTERIAPATPAVSGVAL